MSDKTKKLSLRNSYVREENEDLWIPIIDAEDDNNPGNIIAR